MIVRNFKMPIDVEVLINEIEKRPCLYNKTLKEYSDKGLKEYLWGEICQQVVENWEELDRVERTEKIQEIQSRWKNLRTCFKREYNAQKNTPINTGKKRRKYLYFDQLLFLIPTVEDNRDAETLHSAIKEENAEEIVVEPTTQHISTLEPLGLVKDEPSSRLLKEESTSATAIKIEPTPFIGRSSLKTECTLSRAESTFSRCESSFSRSEPVESSQNLRKKFKVVKPYDEGKIQQPQQLQLPMNFCEKQEEIDEDRFFLLSLLPTFRKLDNGEKFTAKIEILNVLRRITLCRNSDTQE